MTLEPNRDLLEIFIEGLFRHCGADGVVSLRAFFENGAKKSFRITDVPLTGGLPFLMEAAEDDARRAANDPQPVVFCPPVATFLPNGRAREQDLLEAPAFSVELDQNPRAALEGLESLLGFATLVVLSGGEWVNPATGEIEPKLHAHWRLKEPARGTDIAKLKRARQLATALVGGDPTNIPACHPIRWPGSWHRKGSPRLCEIESTDHLDNELDLDVALAALEAVAPQPKTTGQGGAQQSAGTQTGQGVLDLSAVFRKIISGEQFHPVLVPLSSSFAARGTPEAVTRGVLRALLNNTQTADPARLARRDTELANLKDTVRSGYEKFANTAAAPSGALFDPWERYLVPAFPLAILPKIAQEYITTQSTVIGCCPSAVAMSVLATFSGALNHGFALKMLQHGTWYESPRLWVLLVADASQRKTPCLKAASRPLVHYETHLRAKYEQELRDYERNKKQAGQSGSSASQPDEPESPQRYLVWDTTTEKLGEILARCKGKGLLVLTDEVTGWLGSMERYNNASRADRAFWLQAYDGGPRTVDRIKRGEIFIKNLSVSLLACVQPARLAEVQELTSDGLLQRFLPVMVGPPNFRQDHESKDEAYSKLVRELIFAKPARLIMTDDAQAIMTNLHQHLFNLEGASEGLAGFQSFIGKLHGLTGALALILHMAHDPQNGATYAVSKTTVENVNHLMREFILPHAFEFYQGADGADGERLRRLASWILTSGKDRIVASDLTTNVADFRGLPLAEINIRVSPLVAAGWLQPADHTPVCRSWAVNRIVWQQLAARARVEEARKAALAVMMGSRRRKKT
jgi:uncharacterized protein DUF3987